MKNIALALNMYFTDYDAFMGGETRQDVLDYMYTGPGGGDPAGNCEQWPKFASWANPHLRPPVILDEYIKNREVWRCPSAKVSGGASFILPGPDWLQYLKSTAGDWGLNSDIWGPWCITSYPPGWGGDVTDSIGQQRLAGTATGARWPPSSNPSASQAFGQSIGLVAVWQMELGSSTRVSLSQIGDPASYATVVEAGVAIQEPNAFHLAAYPDLCCSACAGFIPWAWGWPQVENGATVCPDGSGCSDCWGLHASYEWAKEPSRRSASARHLGGDNIGFADGHAKWMPAQAILNAGRDGQLTGLGMWCNGLTTEAGYRANCGDPVPGMIFIW